jgi:hypothetical protein
MNMSLEFVLNLLWAVVSLALLSEATKASSRLRAHRALRAFAILALICVLFPIISITDDLNSAPAMVETRQSPELTSQSQHSSGPAGPLPAVLAVQALTSTPQQQESISATTTILLHDVFAFNQSRRPPPLFQV